MIFCITVSLQKTIIYSRHNSKKKWPKIEKILNELLEKLIQDPDSKHIEVIFNSQTKYSQTKLHLFRDLSMRFETYIHDLVIESNSITCITFLMKYDFKFL